MTAAARQTLRNLTALSLACLASLAASPAKADEAHFACDEDVICIREERDGGEIRLMAENVDPLPVREGPW